MKKILFAIILAALLILPSLSFAAGSSVTQTYARVWSTEGPTGVATLTLSWTSDDATGAVSATTSTAITDQIAGKWLVYVVTDPGATAPTDDYDITITDANGVDVMGGTLSNRDTSNSEATLPYVGGLAYGPVPVAGALVLNVTSAGNSKTGTVILYLSR